MALYPTLAFDEGIKIERAYDIFSFLSRLLGKSRLIRGTFSDVDRSDFESTLNIMNGDSVEL